MSGWFSNLPELSLEHGSGCDTILGDAIEYASRESEMLTSLQVTGVGQYRERWLQHTVSEQVQ